LMPRSSPSPTTQRTHHGVTPITATAFLTSSSSCSRAVWLRVSVRVVLVMGSGLSVFELKIRCRLRLLCASGPYGLPVGFPGPVVGGT
jgi:hypothetical protein